MRRSTARLLVPAALIAGLLTACSTGTTATSADPTADASVVSTADTAVASTEVSASVDGAGASAEGSTVTVTAAGT